MAVVRVFGITPRRFAPRTRPWSGKMACRPGGRSSRRRDPYGDEDRHATGGGRGLPVGRLPLVRAGPGIHRAPVARSARHQRGRDRRTRSDRTRRRAVAQGRGRRPGGPEVRGRGHRRPPAAAAQRRRHRCDGGHLGLLSGLAGRLRAALGDLAHPDGPRAAAGLARPADLGGVGARGRADRTRMVVPDPPRRRRPHPLPLPRVGIRLGDGGSAAGVHLGAYGRNMSAYGLALAAIPDLTAYAG